MLISLSKYRRSNDLAFSLLFPNMLQRYSTVYLLILKGVWNSRTESIASKYRSCQDYGYRNVLIYRECGSTLVKGFHMSSNIAQYREECKYWAPRLNIRSKYYYKETK